MNWGFFPLSSENNLKIFFVYSNLVYVGNTISKTVIYAEHYQSPVSAVSILEGTCMIFPEDLFLGVLLKTRRFRR